MPFLVYKTNIVLEANVTLRTCKFGECLVVARVVMRHTFLTFYPTFQTCFLANFFHSRENL